MPSTKELRTETARFDDLYWQSHSESIVEDDAFLQEVVDAAELPVLLAAIAAALGDTSSLSPDLQPP